MSLLYELCAGLFLYLYVNDYLQKLNIDLSKNTAFKTIVFCHNVGLSVFSGYIFYNGFQVITTKTWYDLYGYSSQTLIYDPKFYILVYYFYLSKYYEFFDTWINLLKRRDPGFLQVYHHIGAVIIMGIGYHHYVQSTWLFLMFNSFVHTVMYMYYALTTLKCKIPCKSLLTSLQITQLVSGVCATWYYILFTKMNRIQLFGCILNVLYLKGLIYLFTDFYNKTYKPKDNVIEQKKNNFKK